MLSSCDWWCCCHISPSTPWIGLYHLGVGRASVLHLAYRVAKHKIWYEMIPPTTPKNIQKYTFYITWKQGKHQIYKKKCILLKQSIQSSFPNIQLWSRKLSICKKLKLVIKCRFWVILFEFLINSYLLFWENGIVAKRASRQPGIPTHRDKPSQAPPMHPSNGWFKCPTPRKGISDFYKW